MGNIKSVEFIGGGSTCDLEVGHDDHQFYMSNGMLTSNSHATLYSMIGYQTAYLKAHYPIEFLQANLIDEVNSNAQDAKSNIEKIKKELRQRGVKIVHHDFFVLTSLTPGDSSTDSLHKGKNQPKGNEADHLDKAWYGKAGKPVTDLPPQSFPSPFFSSYFHDDTFML